MSYRSQGHNNRDDHLVNFDESTDDFDNEEDTTTDGQHSRRFRKYRPITQSFYGVHHHKKQDPPTFQNRPQSIRDQTLAINNLGVLPAHNEDSVEGGDSHSLGSSKQFGFPLKPYRTVDPPGSTGQNQSGHEHSSYQHTVHSEHLQGNLQHLLNRQNQQNSSQLLGTSAHSNAFRPSEALSLLFSKRASSLFDNTSMLDNERKSLLSVPPGDANDPSLSPQLRFSSEYHTFGDDVKFETEEEDKLDSMPVPDYPNMTWQDYFLLPITFFPPVFLGIILNFLNAVSYGMIIFPTHLPMFRDFGPDGVAIFLVSTITCQFVLAFGGTGFACAAGGFMLEVIPFLYLMIQTIIEDVGEGNPDRVVATTMIAYSLSSMVTGLAFFLLGYFKLGNLVGFFPRHILVGCIGGVGYFLCQTALETVTRIQLSYYELQGWIDFFQPDKVALWGTSVVLACSLKYLQTRINSPILLPLFYMMIPLIFFSIVYLFDLDTAALQEAGWLFPSQDTSKPFYNFYLHFDFFNTSWSTIPKLMPTMLALTFFGVLHVPINVPAVAVTIKKDVFDVNHELVGHGWSNLISGLCGGLQNYLMYSSSVMFFKSGGDDWFASGMLAVATIGVWIVGPGIVGYIPCVVVGCMIFHLGMVLFKEGVFETWGVMTELEYATIWIIIVAMALMGFVEGVLVGIILACLFFVYIYSHRAPVRSSYSGRAARSTVRRVYHHRQFLDQLGSQIHVLKLQGFMFFGTIDQVEGMIRELFDERNWASRPIRFLLLDLNLVTGIDFSGAEAFIRIRRLVQTRNVHMLICGVSPKSDVGLALHAVGLWDTGNDTLCQMFPSLNSGLEWCENLLLELCYRHPPNSTQSIQVRRPSHNHMIPDVSNSPRTMLIDKAASESLLSESGVTNALQQPMALLVQIFGGSQSGIDDVLFRISNIFTKVDVTGGEVLWNQGDMGDMLYLVESGLLKVLLTAEDGTSKIVESILPGAMVGELSLFTGRPRPFTVICNQGVSGTLWRLSRDAFEKLAHDDPTATIKFMQWSLAYSAQEMSIYSAHAFEML